MERSTQPPTSRRNNRNKRKRRKKAKEQASSKGSGEDEWVLIESTSKCPGKFYQFNKRTGESRWIGGSQEQKTSGAETAGNVKGKRGKETLSQECGFSGKKSARINGPGSKDTNNKQQCQQEDKIIPAPPHSVSSIPEVQQCRPVRKVPKRPENVDVVKKPNAIPNAKPVFIPDAVSASKRKILKAFRIGQSGSKSGTGAQSQNEQKKPEEMGKGPPPAFGHSFVESFVKGQQDQSSSIQKKSEEKGQIPVPKSGFNTGSFTADLDNSSTEQSTSHQQAPCVQIEEDMDWEDSEIMLEIQDVRQKIWRGELEVKGTLTEKIYENVPNVPIRTPCNKFVVVIDTNIIISSKSVLEKLRTMEVPKSQEFTILIPWMVLQELDALKSKVSNKGAKKFRDSTRYLLDLLQTKNQRIKGQLASDAADACREFIMEVPDDSILQCCIQEKKKGAHVILATNDQILCAKAILHEIPSFGEMDVIDKWRNMLKLADQGQKTTSVSSVPTLPIQRERHSVYSVVTPKTTTQPLAENRYVRECGILISVKELLKTCFTKVVEEEMKFQFQELWPKIVKRKPPWSLNDLLYCFKNHWQAVFGEVSSRKGQESLLSMTSILLKSGNSPLGTASKNFFNACLMFLMCLRPRSTYRDLVQLTLKEIQNHLKEWEMLEKNKPSIKETKLDNGARTAAVPNAAVQSVSRMLPNAFPQSNPQTEMTSRRAIVGPVIDTHRLPQQMTLPGARMEPSPETSQLNSQMAMTSGCVAATHWQSQMFTSGVINVPLFPPSYEVAASILLPIMDAAWDKIKSSCQICILRLETPMHYSTMDSNCLNTGLDLWVKITGLMSSLQQVLNMTPQEVTESGHIVASSVVDNIRCLVNWLQIDIPHTSALNATVIIVMTSNANFREKLRQGLEDLSIHVRALERVIKINT